MQRADLATEFQLSAHDQGDTTAGLSGETPHPRRQKKSCQGQVIPLGPFCKASQTHEIQSLRAALLPLTGHELMRKPLRNGICWCTHSETGKYPVDSLRKAHTSSQIKALLMWLRLNLWATQLAQWWRTCLPRQEMQDRFDPGSGRSLEEEVAASYS